MFANWLINIKDRLIREKIFTLKHDICLVCLRASAKQYLHLTLHNHCKFAQFFPLI